MQLVFKINISGKLWVRYVFKSVSVRVVCVSVLLSVMFCVNACLFFVVVVVLEICFRVAQF